MNAVTIGITSGIIGAIYFQDSTAGYLAIPTYLSGTSLVATSRKRFLEKTLYEQAFRRAICDATFFFTVSFVICMYRNPLSVDQGIIFVGIIMVHLLALGIIARRLLQRSLQFQSLVQPFRNRLEGLVANIENMMNVTMIDKKHYLNKLNVFREKMYQLSPLSANEIYNQLKKQDRQMDEIDAWVKRYAG